MDKETLRAILDERMRMGEILEEERQLLMAEPQAPKPLPPWSDEEMDTQPERKP